MKIRLNGNEHETDAGTIAALLMQLGLAPQTALVEHNGQARKREEWDVALLCDGDRIEVLRVAAGG